MPRARNPLSADNTTSSMNSNAILLHDERRVKGCKDFVGKDCAAAAKISSNANYLAHSCSDYLAHHRSWRAPVIPRSA